MDAENIVIVMDEDLKLIRRLHKEGISIHQIAEKYDVKVSTIKLILSEDSGSQVGWPVTNTQ